PERGKAHAIGASSLHWGEGKLLPFAGDDPVYTVWRWTDCCNTGLGEALLLP
ncbi:MAG: TraU family protein, partial [Duodenibacillus sp.]|nr:TraU family protein [Duodenibacillus sp.]